MLSLDDVNIVQRDKALPALATLLDPEEFLCKLRSSLPDIEFSCAIPTYVRYKPGMNCLVAYRVTANGELLDVYAKAHRPEDHVKLEKARVRSATVSALGPGRVVLDDSSLVISILPNDSKLKSLRSLGDATKRARLLQTLFPHNSELWNGTLVRLQYKPERRYVAQLRVGSEPKAVLKFYAGHGYKTIQQNTASLDSRGTLRIAQQRGYADDQYVLAFEWLEGRLLRDLFTSREETLDDLSAVGGALAALHAQSPKRLTQVSRASEATALVAIAEAVNQLLPQHAARTSGLARRLAAKLLSLDPVRHMIHGDFYDKQVLLIGDSIGMLDFDEAVCGDPASDLGNFVAHLECLAVRGDIDSPHVEALNEAFFDGYHIASGSAIPSHTQLYTAARAFLLLPNPFRHREPDWLSRTEAMLERAENLFENSHRAARPVHFQFT